MYNLDDIEVFCDAPVARILLNNSKRAMGIELVSGDKLFASQEIVISCDTQVTKHSTSQIVNSPEVSQNLCDHNVLTQYYELKDSSKGLAHPFSGNSKVEYSQGSPFDFAFSRVFRRRSLSYR